MSEWDVHAEGWDDDPAVRAYAAAAYESLIERLGSDPVARLPGASVCDFGCGTGQLTERLLAAGARVDAVDSSPAMLDVVRSKARREGWDALRILDALPDDACGYDLIVCSSVLSFVDDHPATVAILSGRLAAGGWFVQWDWEGDPDGDASHGLTREQIAGALHDAGLVDVEVGVGFAIEVDGATMCPLMGSGRSAGGENRTR